MPNFWGNNSQNSHLPKALQPPISAWVAPAGVTVLLASCSSFPPSPLSESGIFLLQPLYSNLQNPQTPPELAPWHQPALPSGSSVLSFPAGHTCCFHMFLPVYLSDGWLFGSFPMGCGLSLNPFLRMLTYYQWQLFSARLCNTCVLCLDMRQSALYLSLSAVWWDTLEFLKGQN